MVITGRYIIAYLGVAGIKCQRTSETVKSFLCLSQLQ